MNRLILALLAGGLLLAFPAQAGTRLRPVPVLMYHVISSPPAGAPYPDLYVPRADFAAQVAWPAARGYRAVTLQQVFDSWRGSRTLPQKPVVLSFDDGYLGATTTRYGLARPGELYTLARVRVSGSDGARGLAAKLEALAA